MGGKWVGVEFEVEARFLCFRVGFISGVGWVPAFDGYIFLVVETEHVCDVFGHVYV